ncbi:hypothetical protein ACS0TY_001060 [Phlomoides rotata]
MYSGNYLLLLSLTTLLHTPTLAATVADATAPLNTNRPAAIFAFGDSILDPGNNNDLLTNCHSNHKPYGMNLDGQKPSGRFSNGKLPMDILISNLGIKSILPAFHDRTVNAEALLTGVSFAAACTGLDELTAVESNVPRMKDQLKDFKDAVERMQKVVGMHETGRILEHSLFVVAAGTNDMMNNFYTVPARKTYTLSGYHDMLLGKLETFIKRLVGQGAVRVAVAGLPPIGCLPAQVTVNSVETGSINRECYAKHNYDSEMYNAKLQSIILKLQLTMPKCRFAYVDIYTPILDMVHHPEKYGFERTHEGCCGSGSVEIGLMCNKDSLTCTDPSKYVFWDAAHPTQAAYNFIVDQFQNTLLDRLMS